MISSDLQYIKKRKKVWNTKSFYNNIFFYSNQDVLDNWHTLRHLPSIDEGLGGNMKNPANNNCDKIK